MLTMRRSPLYVATLLLSACGGGGGSGEAPPPAAAQLIVSGTAAVGAPLTGAEIEVKCATGTGSTSTDAQGVYAVSIAGGSAPCLVKASAGTIGAGGAANTDTLLGVTDAAGKANVTPLTQLILAQALGQEPGAAFAASLPNDKLALAQLDAAWSSVKTSLRNFGIDVAGLDGNPVGAPFTADSATDPLDQSLEALKSRLEATGSTLAALTQALADGSTDLSAAACPVTQQTADYLGPSCWQHVIAYDPQVRDAKVEGGLTTLGGGAVKLTKAANAGLFAADVGSGGALNVYDASYTFEDQIAMLCRDENKLGDLGPNVARYLLLAPTVTLRRDLAVLNELKGQTLYALENCRVSNGDSGEFARTKIDRVIFNPDGTANWYETHPGTSRPPSEYFDPPQL